jgi:uncharacterized protein (TIGR02145 family)
MIIFFISEVCHSKALTIQGWSEGGNGINETGFTGLPGGCRNANGTFTAVGFSGYWWGATEGSATGAWARDLDNSSNGTTRTNEDKKLGFSVR